MNLLSPRSVGRAIQVLGCIFVLFLLCVPAFSQANFGRILGIVTDTSGGVVANATVTIIDADRGVARILTTDQAGEYNAPTLIPGTYTVRVEAKGFKKFERQNVFVGVGKEVQVDLVVQPGAQEQTVIVTESIPLVETTNATLGGSLSNADIQDLPLNGRNYQYLLNLRPGVMIQPGGGPWTQSTNNVRPDESAWLVDGVMNASMYDARPIVGSSSYITDGATIMPIDAIQEFNLEENPKAEYGWKPGAVVNVGIRSGTNTLHGAAYAFGRADSFDARNRFNPGPANGACYTVPASTCDKLPVELKQFGAVVGGPIKKDKLFFFAGYEGQRSLIGNAFTTKVPETASQAASATAPGDPKHSMVDAIRALQGAGVAVSPVSLQLLGCPTGALTTASTCTGGFIQGASPNSIQYLSSFPNVQSSDNGVAKIDYRVSPKHTINGMFWIGKYNSPTGEDHVATNSNWTDSAVIPNWTVVGNWVWTPTSRVVNEVRFGYTRSGQKILPFDRNVFADGKSYPLNTGVTSFGGFPTVQVNGFGQSNRLLGSWINRPAENGPNPFFDGQDSVSYLIGKHTVKFGAEIAHIETDSFVHDTRGRIDFQGGTLNQAAFLCPPPNPQNNSCSAPLEDLFAGSPSRGFLLVGDAHRTLHWMSYAGFVQDDWRVTTKLILNVGLRYSYTQPIKEANNLLGNFDPKLGLVQQGQSSVGDTLWKPDHKNFSPRVGFAWDVSGKGTTVVRAGASVIYSTLPAAAFLQQAGLNNFNGGTIGAVPTGATCNGNPCSTSGSTITLGSARFSGGALTWNAPPGGPGVFPSGAFVCRGGPGQPNRRCNILAVDPNLRTPYITNWNLSVTRAFSNNLSLEVGYVGNHGTSLVGFRDINQRHPFDSVNDAQGHPMSYLGFINLYSNDARSNYHSLQATLTKRTSHGLSFLAGYTYGHGLDNGSENRMGPTPQDSRFPGAEYASSDFDVRHRFTLTTTYEIPGIKGFGQLLEGWQLNSIVSLQTAQPWNIADTGNDFSGTGESQDRWDFFGNPKDFKSGANSLMYCTGGGNGGCSQTSGITSAQFCGSAVGTGPGGSCDAATSAALWGKCTAVAPDAGTLGAGGCFLSGNSVMVPPTAGTFGTMGRNIFRDNGFKNWDFSVFKTFKFKERYSAQFRVEFFDVLNHATVSNPNGANNGSHNGDDPSSPKTFGCGCQTPDFATGNPIIGSGGDRAIQLGLKLMF